MQDLPHNRFNAKSHYRAENSVSLSLSSKLSRNYTKGAEPQNRKDRTARILTDFMAKGMMTYTAFPNKAAWTPCHNCKCPLTTWFCNQQNLAWHSSRENLWNVRSAKIMYLSLALFHAVLLALTRRAWCLLDNVNSFLLRTGPSSSEDYASIMLNFFGKPITTFATFCGTTWAT